MTVRALNLRVHAVGIHVSQTHETRPRTLIWPCQKVCTSQNMVNSALFMVNSALFMVNSALFGTVWALFGTVWYTVHPWVPVLAVSTQ